MGLFDTVRMISMKFAGEGDFVGFPTCLEGHPLDSFQTKDLGEGMNEYIVAMYVTGDYGEIFRVGELKNESVTLISDGTASLEKRHEMHRLQGVTSFFGLTACHKCTPVFCRTGWGNTMEVYPSHEVKFEAVPEYKNAWRWISVKGETREDVKRRNPDHLPEDFETVKKLYESYLNKKE